RLAASCSIAIRRFPTGGVSDMRLVRWTLMLLAGALWCAAADTQWIDDAGGTVIKDAAGRITGIDLRATWITDTDLRRLAQFPNLTALDLSLTRITDQGMLELKNLSGIVDLNLYFAEYVTDEGMAAIKGWKKLKRL